MYNGWTDRHTDDQRETIIPHHYRVAGYKNVYIIKKKDHKRSFFYIIYNPYIFVRIQHYLAPFLTQKNCAVMNIVFRR